MTDRDDLLIERIRTLSRPLQPLPTDLPPHLPRIAGLKAVLFDVYGTLFVSAAGDIGVGLAIDGDTAFRAALESVGLPPKGTAALLTGAIEAEHARRRAAGIDWPEVDIVAIWRTVLQRLGLFLPDDRLRRLALEYELRVNPVWPMPGLEETLTALGEGEITLGIVSNAQFYTLLLFPAFLGRTLEELGFSPDLCLCSWQVGVAKPSRRLYDLAAAALRRRGIAPQQVLYLGNDVRNDIWPAAQAGFHTALFAGDARSLRLREDDPRCRGVRSDAVVTALPQIVEMTVPGC